MYFILLFFVDNEDANDTAVDGIDVQNFGFPYNQVEHQYPEFQHEWPHFLPI